MKKKYILLTVGIIILLVPIISFIFSQQNDKQQTLQNISPSQSQDATIVGQTKKIITIIPTVTLAPPASSAYKATLQFYTFYFSSFNPLANGGYKNNPYLSQNFKDVIGNLYNNGNTPVFCLQNRRSNITVGHEQQYYYNGQYLTQEVISDASNTKELYRVTLEDTGGSWLIFDINCIN